MQIFIKSYLVVILIEVRSNEEIVNQWIDLLTLKNHIAEVSSEELCDVSKEEDYYEFFLTSSLQLLKEEPAFLLLDETFLEKMSKVVSVRRFDYQGMPLYSLSNNLIIGVNQLQCLSELKKKSRVLHYLAFQEDCRGQHFLLLGDLIQANARDLWVYRSIQEEEDYLTDMDILSGLRYFACTFPEVFQDEKFMMKTQNFVDSCCNVPIVRKLGKQYHMALDTRAVLQKVKKSSR